MIHRFRTQNFKSIRDANVQLSPVTVLVGRSGTGKSNFVDSLRFFRDTVNRSNVQEKSPQIRPATDPNALAGFEVEFSIKGILDRFVYELRLSANGPADSLILEKLTLGEKCLFVQGRDIQGSRVQEPRWLVAPNLIDVPKPGPIALGRIPSITEVVIAFTALTTGIGNYRFRDTVLCGGASNQSVSGLSDDAGNYLEVLKDIVSNLQDLNVRKSIVGALQRVNSSVESAEFDNIQSPKHVVVGHKFDSKILTLLLSQESDGFRRFYAHLLALYQRPPKQSLVFEHPEDLCSSSREKVTSTLLPS